MRLIDADKLIDNLDGMIPATDDGDYAMGIATAIQEVGRMAYEDYIEAIPVEWLKAYFKKCLSFDDRVFIDNEDSNYDIVIDKYKIFEEWEKENETN